MKNPYAEYRKEHFAIDVTSSNDDVDGLEKVNLSVTPNDRQWMTISFTKQEWKMIKKQVDEKFKSMKSGA